MHAERQTRQRADKDGSLWTADAQEEQEQTESGQQDVGSAELLSPLQYGRVDQCAAPLPPEAPSGKSGTGKETGQSDGRAADAAVPEGPQKRFCSVASIDTLPAMPDASAPQCLTTWRIVQ